MQQEDTGALFIKHYHNFQRLSVEQLNAIKEEKLNIVAELVAQKQIIMDSIMALQVNFDVNSLQSEIKEQLKELWSQIDLTENESKQILNERCTNISKRMLAARKEITVQGAYEDRSYQGHGIMLNVIK